MTLTNEACRELAELIVGFASQLPDELVPRLTKIKVRASESLILASLQGGREEYEKFLQILHYWLERQGIEAKKPDDNNKAE